MDRETQSPLTIKRDRCCCWRWWWWWWWWWWGCGGDGGGVVVIIGGGSYHNDCHGTQNGYSRKRSRLVSESTYAIFNRQIIA